MTIKFLHKSFVGLNFPSFLFFLLLLLDSHRFGFDFYRTDMHNTLWKLFQHTTCTQSKTSYINHCKALKLVECSRHKQTKRWKHDTSYPLSISFWRDSVTKTCAKNISEANDRECTLKNKNETNKKGRRQDMGHNANVVQHTPSLRTQYILLVKIVRRSSSRYVQRRPCRVRVAFRTKALKKLYVWIRNKRKTNVLLLLCELNGERVHPPPGRSDVRKSYSSGWRL